MLRFIRRFVCVMLCMACFICCTACKTNKENEIEKEKVFQTGIDGPIYLDFGDVSDKSVYVNIPLPIGDYCHTIYSSDLEKGWVELTVCALDENHPIFTIYTSLNETYKDFENEKEYEVLLQNDECTVVWHEYNETAIDDEIYTEAITNIKNNLTAVKKSVVILIEEEEGTIHG